MPAYEASVNIKTEDSLTRHGSRLGEGGKYARGCCKAGRGRKSCRSSDDIRNPIKGLRSPAKYWLRGLVEQGESGDPRQGERKPPAPLQSRFRGDQPCEESQHTIRYKVHELVWRDRRGDVKRHIQPGNVSCHDEHDCITGSDKTQVPKKKDSYGGSPSDGSDCYAAVTASARELSIVFRGAESRLCPKAIKTRRAVGPPLEPRLQPIAALGLADSCSEEVTLPTENQTKQMRQRTKRLHEHPRNKTVAKGSRRLRQIQAVAVAIAMPEVRRVGVDRLLHLPFGPAKNKVWNLGVVNASAKTAVAEDSGHFVRLRDAEKFNPPHQAAVSCFDQNHVFPGNAIHLEQNTVGRPAMMQCCMGHDSIERLIGKRERVPIPVSERPAVRKRRAAKPEVEQGDIGKSEMPKHMQIVVLGADNQDLGLLIREPRRDRFGIKSDSRIEFAVGLFGCHASAQGWACPFNSV